MSTHCGICFGQGHAEKNCDSRPRQLDAGQVEVHGTTVYRKGSTHWELVGSCTSEEAARAVARLLSF